MPDSCQISTSLNVMADIEVYIETSVADKMLFKKLTDNAQLLDDVKRSLLMGSSGMYDINFRYLAKLAFCVLH